MPLEPTNRSLELDGQPCTASLQIAKTRYYVVRIDPQCSLVLATRSPERFASPSEIAVCFEEVAQILAKVDRKSHKLLVDVRQGPARNDPEFEEAIRTHRGKLLLGFARNAALAATAVGRLQIQRYAQRDQREVFATNDPAEAFRHLGVRAHEL